VAVTALIITKFKAFQGVCIGTPHKLSLTYFTKIYRLSFIFFSLFSPINPTIFIGFRYRLPENIPVLYLSKEELIITEQELLDMFIQECINMLLDIFNKNQPDKSKKEDEQILQA